MVKGLEDLEIYIIACKLEKEVYKITERFPIEEKYGKTSQLRRSVSSVADNIAEGYGRFGYQDKIQFIYIARGSAEEARSQINRSRMFIDNVICSNLISEYTIEIKKINGYIRFLKNKKTNTPINRLTN